MVKKENMDKETIATNKAPAAVGPYSQAVRIGKLIFTAGQVALVPGTGKLRTGGIIEQTQQVMMNLEAVLKAAGSNLDQAIKSTVFLQDMADFAAMNGEYAKAFSSDPPARSTVEVSKLPLGALVEIELVAHIPGD
ncbi:MAG: RidA family protein [Anaerolineae bacterium]|nr:MAG: RidA family protein [Anaerolineae bacterium]